MTDLMKLKRFESVTKPGTVLKKVLQEVNALIPKVSAWNLVPGGGSAVCRYDVNTGLPASYTVNYQQGNMGNLVHELIHVAVNESYGQDFVNFYNPGAAPAARRYDVNGYCLNEFDRQTAYMGGAGGNSIAKIGASLQGLSAWANASTELKSSQRTDIVTKLGYGQQWPHKEYDTVITQVLVWLTEWGYPIAGATRGKPVVNALYEEVEKAVGRAYADRQSAQQLIAAARLAALAQKQKQEQTERLLRSRSRTL